MLIKDKDITSYKLLLIKQDRVLASLTSESGMFFSYFSKKWVGQAMGNETFYWYGLIPKQLRNLRMQLWNAPELRESLTSRFAEVRITGFLWTVWGEEQGLSIICKENSGNFGWEFLFRKNGMCRLPFA